MWSDAIDKQVGKLPLPWFTGRGLLLDAAGAAVLTALVAAAGRQLEEGPLDIRIPAKVHYRGVLHDKELCAGVLAALVQTDPAVRECLQEAAHTASTYGRPTTTPSTRQAGARTESSRRSPSSRRDFGVIGSVQRN